MRTTNSSNAQTYQEYLEKYVEELQQDSDFWYCAWKKQVVERDYLQARINELNKECDDMAAFANVKEDEIVVLTIQNQKLKAYIDKQKEETVGLHVVEAVEAENAALEAERDALKEEVERCEAAIRFWKKGACDLLQELEER